MRLSRSTDMAPSLTYVRSIEIPPASEVLAIFVRSGIGLYRIAVEEATRLSLGPMGP